MGLADPSQKHRIALGGGSATRRWASVLAAFCWDLVLVLELPKGVVLGSQWAGRAVAVAAGSKSVVPSVKDSSNLA